MKRAMILNLITVILVLTVCIVIADYLTSNTKTGGNISAVNGSGHATPSVNIPLGNGFPPRYQHGGVVLPDGDIVIAGGWNGVNRLNDTWRSTDGGYTWNLMNASSGWIARAGQAMVANGNKIILMGGADGTNYYNDTWQSTDEGTHWTNVTGNPGWFARASFSSVALPDGNLLLTGGTNNTLLNDTWRSTDNGTTWMQKNSSSGWTAREHHKMVVMPDRSVLLISGYTAATPPEMNDTWRSTNDGATWNLMNASPGWLIRSEPVVVSFPDGDVIITAGDDGIAGAGGVGFHNDTWRSSDNGATWTNITGTPQWSAREWATSIRMPSGSIVMVGGTLTGSAGTNETWISSDEGITWKLARYSQSTVANLTSPAPNVSAISARNTPVFPNFVANATTAIAPTAIQFNDTTSGYPTVWNWSFGDGSYSISQNPVHTYQGYGMYTVSLNDSASPSGAYNTTTKTDFIILYEQVHANITSNVSSGQSPLAVQFTDTSTGLNAGMFWSEVTPQAPWINRSEAGLVSLNGIMSIVGGSWFTNGGVHGIIANDVWNTTNGATWQESTSTSFPSRSYGQATTFNGKMWVAGGWTVAAPKVGNDTWYSSDGITWTEATAHAPWLPRVAHGFLSYNNYLWIIGGDIVPDTANTGSTMQGNDVWYSSDGITWNEATASAAFCPRDSFGYGVYNGKMWVVGGYNWSSGNALSDAWYSTDGVTWTESTAQAPFPSRISGQSQTFDNKLWYFAGSTGSVSYNDAWYTTDGITWLPTNVSSAFPGRTVFSSTVFNNHLWVMAGQLLQGDTYGSYNDTWETPAAGQITYSWNFGDGGTSTAQNPIHTYTSPGIYTVTETTNNGYTSNTTVESITVASSLLAFF
jgi:PKD repeat protein